MHEVTQAVEHAFVPEAPNLHTRIPAGTRGHSLCRWEERGTVWHLFLFSGPTHNRSDERVGPHTHLYTSVVAERALSAV
jgi:hypothetical protein